MLLHALCAVCSFGALQELPHGLSNDVPQQAPLVATWTVDTTTPFVGEMIALEFALEGSSEFLANEVVPRTLRRLGRAVEFDTGFRPAAAALLEVVGFVEDPSGPTCVVDGTVVSGARLELADGRERFAVRVDVLAAAAGVVQPAPRLVFAVRRARGAGVFGAEVTSDYELHELAVDAPSLEVRALPGAAEGLAVGVFELVCDAPSTQSAAVGERLALVVRVRGAENLEHVHVPRLESGAALHVLGVLEARTATERVFTFDVEVLAAPAAPCEFVLETFDPTGAGRVVEHRVPVGLAIVAPNLAAELPAPTPTSTDDHPPAHRDLRLLAWCAVVAFGAFAAFVLVVRRRARRLHELPDALLVAAHAARRAAFERGDTGAALAAFVETLFEVPVAARSGAALLDHLTRCGVPPELAARVGERVDAALHARYGGEVRATEPSAVDDLCAELERIARPNPRNVR
jgi:hypothetical protein